MPGRGFRPQVLLHGGSMRDDPYGKNRKRRVVGAQAGKLLCVSETIFPPGSRQNLNMLCWYEDTGEGPQRRLAGGEFEGLPGIHGAAPGSAWTVGRS
jgi:hypothetical protein